MNTVPTQSDEEAHAAPSLTSMVLERGTNMGHGRDAKIIALLAENGIDTAEQFEKFVLAYATKRDALREGLFKCIKKLVKIGVWEAPSLLLPSHPRSRATVLPMALALGWASTAIADTLKRNKLNAKYNPQDIPEKHSYYAKGMKTAVQLFTDIPALLVPSKGLQIVRTAAQTGMSFGAAYVLNNRKAVGKVKFLDGDHPELLETLLERRKQSNHQALGEFINNDLFTLPGQVPRAMVTATISPKTLIKTAANAPLTLALSYVPSDNLARIIRDAASLPRKFLKKQVKQILDYLEQRGHLSYTHKRMSKIADAWVDSVVLASGNLSRQMYARVHPSTQTAEERQPLLAAAAAEEGVVREPIPPQPISQPDSPGQELSNPALHPNAEELAGHDNNQTGRMSRFLLPGRAYPESRGYTSSLSPHEAVRNRHPSRSGSDHSPRSAPIVGEPIQSEETSISTQDTSAPPEQDVAEDIPLQELPSPALRPKPNEPSQPESTQTERTSRLLVPVDPDRRGYASSTSPPAATLRQRHPSSSPASSRPPQR